MPLYVFRCDECGRVREFLASVEKEEGLTMDCPAGCVVPMKRLPTSAVFQLKGHGFHDNDYGKIGPKTK